MSALEVDSDAGVKLAPPANADKASKASWPILEKYIAFDTQGAEPVASATKQLSIAIGTAAEAHGNVAIALGHRSRGLATDAIAIGTDCVSDGTYGITIGDHSAATNLAVALGSGAKATHSRSVALGSVSITDKDNTVSVGSLAQRRAIRFLADGELTASSHEAITGAQLFATHQKIERLEAVDNYIAINQTGSSPTATSSNIAIGQSANASGHIGIAFGVDSIATGNYGMAFGSYAVAADNALALGVSAKATHARAVALGSQSITDKDNTVSVGSLSQRRAIRFVAEGELSSTSHEAITGRQLFAANQKIAASQAAIDNNAQNIVTATTRIDALGDQLNQGTVGLVQQNAASRSLTLGATVDGRLIDAAGSNGSRRLTGLSDGHESSDAVTFGQLEAVRRDPQLARYDNDARSQLTLNPGGGATRLSNVSAAVAGGDAVNKQQLDKVSARVTQLIIDQGTLANDLTNLRRSAVQYDPESGDIPVDESKITGLADGTQAKDAVNKGQLDAAIASVDQKLADAVVYANPAHTQVTLNAGKAAARLSNVATGAADLDAVNFAQVSPVLGKARYLAVSGKTDAQADGAEAVALGGGASAAKEYSVALGSKATAGGSYDVAVGRSAKATAEYSSDGFYYAGVAVGYGSETSSSGVALGQSAKALARGAIAMGTSASAPQRYATALGHVAEAGEEYAVAIGARAKCRAGSSVALGANSLAEEDDIVSVGNSGYTRRVTNVSLGIDPNDAATVAQLRIAHQQLEREAELRYQQLEQRYAALHELVRQLSAKVG